MEIFEMIKNGDMHVESLRDGRTVYIDGHQVAEPVDDPAFRNAVRSYAQLYNHQAQNPELMTFETETGKRVNRMWELPTSYEQLVKRREALESWSEQHYGFLGRSPDHVASCISGMYMGLPVFEQYDQGRAKALADYYRYARDNDLFLTYVIINPQADRSKAAHEQADPYLTTGVVDEDAEGITVRGAKMLATSGIMANEVFVTCIQPLREGDEIYALSFVIPMNAKGLRVLSRKSYEAGAQSRFDNPLASRFDENDAVLYFEDVKVPWERVFVHKNVQMVAKQFHATPAHVHQNYQCQIRLMVKMRFLAGLARGITETNGTSAFPQVREMLGQIAAEAKMVDALVRSMEVKGRMENGYFVPDRHTLYSAQVLTQQLYGKVITSLRDLAGGGVIMLPSSIEDFADPYIASIIDKTQQSPVRSSRERVKFFKLVWDAIGSEFASRHSQYEMFYAGATFVTKGHSFRSYDWEGAGRLVEDCLSSYSLDEELQKVKRAAE
ncbi:4-hydroxyphenylacetate 3-hydroxylase family protein [Lutibaculum baratangense]|uniref:4-hydroxyphenylacetate 3-monooxygenase n=1 Tax=Lutibaculum baratangense AMV1 TaxID=631454 RepID=V4RJN2_9HYPH|nr:4-hydroxyphenylacetate 3-hydroxylase N-terminal domain-containing protein [Lutibaculum baratangense]ESR23445.1 4-hydroxyphenylacetate 3-monooxygenase [Lutibaculum baratangense AMV1]